MLFKIDNTSISLDDIFYIDLESNDDNILDFYFNDDEPFSIECEDINQVLEDLKKYKFLFYLEDSKTILNLKLVLSITIFTDHNDNCYLKIITKNNYNLTLSLYTDDYSKANKILEEMSRL